MNPFVTIPFLSHAHLFFSTGGGGGPIERRLGRVQAAIGGVLQALAAVHP